MTAVAKPDWLIIGKALPDGSYRMWASNRLYDVDFSVTENIRAPASYGIESRMENMIVATGRDARDCMEQVQVIWENEERRRELRKSQGRSTG